MPHTNTFPPGTQVHIIANDTHEAAYWRENGKAYGRLRLKGHQSWEDTLVFDVPVSELDRLESYFEQARQERNRMLDYYAKHPEAYDCILTGGVKEREM